MIFDMMLSGPAWVLAQVPIVPEGPITFPTQFDTDLVMWSALVSQVLPLGIARVVGATWSKDAKIAASILVCFLTSLVTTFFLGKLDPANIITSLLVIFTMTSVMYRQVWRESGTIERLERA